MNRRSVPPRAEGQDAFDAKLIRTPGLAEAYIHVTQEIYEKKVKSGELPPAEAKQALALVRLFHREMTSVIVRRELARMARRMLRLKRKERLTPKDMKFLEQCAQELPMLAKQIKQGLKEQRQFLDDFLNKVGFELILLSEQMLVQGIGKAVARELMTESGGMLPSDLVKQAKRRRVQSRRAPGAARVPAGRGPATGRRRTGR